MSELTTRYQGADGKLLKEAHARFKMGEEASTDQRKRNLEALRFYNDDQWPEDIKRLRAGTSGDGGAPAVPARPCITINRVKEPVKQVLNQMRQSDMGAEITPADDFGDVSAVDDEEIELREGLLRRIQRAPETSDAIVWMGTRAAICGEGYLIINTRYLQGRTFDQEPYVMRVYNQASVMLDPSHEQPDGSDADWAMVGTDMPYDQYEAQYGEVDGKKNPLAGCDDEKWRALGDEEPIWFQSKGEGEEKTRFVRVVDYYYTHRDSVDLALMPDGSIIKKSEVPEGVEPVQTRTEVQKSIKWAKFDGYQVLEKTDWAGPDIPVVKCLGEEIQPYDQERRSVGMVTVSAMEGNRGGNYMISKLVEIVGIAPIPQIMMASGQDEGYEQEYATMNTRTLPLLHYNQKDSEGAPAPPPFRPPVDTQIGPTVAALQFFNDAVLAVVGQPSPTMGEVDPSIKTARGLQDLLQQAEHGNSNYMDNLARSVRRMAVILNGLFYPLYGTKPGRMARIVNGENEPEMVTINPEEQRNVTPGGPLPQGSPMGMEAGAQPEKPRKTYTLTKDANFNVAVKVTKNFDTMREKEATMLGELISSNPEFMGWYGDKYIEASNIPGRKELAERTKVMLAPPIQEMLAAKAKNEPMPPHAQAQIAQAKDLVQKLTQQVEQLMKERETDGIKEQAATERTQMQDQTKQLLEQMKAQNEQQLLLLKQQFEQGMAQFEAQQAAITREDEQRHEMALAAAEAAQKAQDAEAARAHDAQMGRQAVEAGEIAGESSHARAIDLQERQPKDGDE